jgi:hypothetical protein
MSATKLKNAPLKEVIFELHWECSNDPSGVKIDRGFDLAQGKFADLLKPEFPLHRRLIPDAVSPFFLSPYTSILEWRTAVASCTAWSRTYYCKSNRTRI